MSLRLAPKRRRPARGALVIAAGVTALGRGGPPDRPGARAGRDGARQRVRPRLSQPPPRRLPRTRGRPTANVVLSGGHAPAVRAARSGSRRAR